MERFQIPHQNYGLDYIEQRLLEKSIDQIWTRTHSAQNVITMCDHYLNMKKPKLDMIQTTVVGLDILSPIADLALHIEKRERAKLTSAAIDLLKKHNSDTECQSLVLAYFASNLNAKGLTLEGKQVEKKVKSHKIRRIIIYDLD